MTTDEEKTLKKWLFGMYEKHKHPNFFLAGAIIGMVDDVYKLAEKFGIESEVVRKFFRQMDTSPKYIRERDRIVMVRSLDRWSQGKNISPQIVEILTKCKDDKVRMCFGEVAVTEEYLHPFFLTTE